MLKFQNLKIKVVLGRTNERLNLDLNESIYNEWITGKKCMKFLMKIKRKYIMKY